MTTDQHSSRPLIIQTEHLHADAAAWLGERCELVACPSEDEPRFGELLSRADGLVIRTYTLVNEAMLARAPRLRVVARAGVGLDNVDVAACERRGVRVLNTPDANTRAVVELVTCLMLDALRPRVFLEKALEAKPWKQLRSDLIASRQLSDLTLGVLGLGKIGKQVARVGAAFNMRVIYHDIVEIPASERHGAVCVDRETLFSESDVLTVHVDGRRENHGIVDAASLRRCRPGVVFINTSRGFVIDNEAMASFLRVSEGAQAFLDVHEPEPFPEGYPLLGIPNAHLSPHIASATATAHRNMSWVVKDLWAAIADTSGR